MMITISALFVRRGVILMMLMPVNALKLTEARKN